MKAERDAHDSLKHLFCEIGFPRVLKPDHAQSLTEGEFRRVANRAQVPIHSHEPYHPNQNLAEDTICEGIRLYSHHMNSCGIPKAFWDRVFIYCLEIRLHIVLALDIQEGENGATIITGNTSDISHLVDFGIYDWCWVLSPSSSSQPSKQLC